jgi:hypothetical protein
MDKCRTPSQPEQGPTAGNALSPARQTRIAASAAPSRASSIPGVDKKRIGPKEYWDPRPKEVEPCLPLFAR